MGSLGSCHCQRASGCASARTAGRHAPEWRRFTTSTVVTPCVQNPLALRAPARLFQLKPRLLIQLCQRGSVNRCLSYTPPLAPQRVPTLHRGKRSRSASNSASTSHHWCLSNSSYHCPSRPTALGWRQWLSSLVKAMLLTVRLKLKYSTQLLWRPPLGLLNAPPLDQKKSITIRSIQHRFHHMVALWQLTRMLRVSCGATSIKR